MPGIDGYARGPDMDRLSALWSRIGDLTSAETSELYVLLWAVLESYRPPILDSLPFTHEDYFHDFFVLQVQRGCGGESRSLRVNKSYLRRSYKWFLLDRNRAMNRDPIDIAGRADDDAEHPVHLLDDLQQTSYDASDAHLQSAESAPGPDRILQDAGYTSTHVAVSAQKFLKRSPEWVLLYLALNHCPEFEEHVPLVKIKEMYAIKSHHYKAVKLGITMPGKALPGDYDNTMIGTWLKHTLGVPLDKSHPDVIHAALQFLCYEVLRLWAERNGDHRIPGNPNT